MIDFGHLEAVFVRGRPRLLFKKRMLMEMRIDFGVVLMNLSLSDILGGPFELIKDLDLTKTYPITHTPLKFL